tara:strand:+ start:1816 stop:1956 length:141 start_codon:yes stop_codon:yes gene_type:complete
MDDLDSLLIDSLTMVSVVVVVAVPLLACGLWLFDRVTCAVITEDRE